MNSEVYEMLKPHVGKNVRILISKGVQPFELGGLLLEIDKELALQVERRVGTEQVVDPSTRQVVGNRLNVQPAFIAYLCAGLNVADIVSLHILAETEQEAFESVRQELIAQEQSAKAQIVIPKPTSFAPSIRK